MSQSINWDMLETQYYSDGQYRERLSKMVTVIDDAFTAGQNFIQNFNQSLHQLKEDIDDTRKIQSLEAKTDGSCNNSQKSPELLNADQSIFLLKTQNNSTLKTNELQLPLNDILSKNLSHDAEGSTLTKLMKYILPLSAQNKNKKIDITKTNWWEREALQFMRGMMDECTHLKNFSVPFDTSLIIAVCARDDAYVPRDGCSSLEDIWPGAEVKYLDAGHVSAYVLHQKLFR